MKRFIWSINIKYVKEIFRLYLYYHLSLKEIKEELERQGIPSPKGKKRWSEGVIRQILKNPIYMGITEQGLRSPPIVDEWEWSRVQWRLIKNRGMSKQFIQTKQIRCKKCNIRMSFRKGYYNCTGCKQKIRGKDLEAAVWKEVQKQIREKLGLIVDNQESIGEIGRRVIERIGNINDANRKERVRTIRNWITIESERGIKVGGELVEVEGLSDEELVKTLEIGEKWKGYLGNQVKVKIKDNRKLDLRMLFQEIERMEKEREAIKKEYGIYDDEDFVDDMLEGDEPDDALYDEELDDYEPDEEDYEDEEEKD